MMKITVSADTPEEIRTAAEAIRQRLDVIRIKIPAEKKEGKYRLYARARKK